MTILSYNGQNIEQRSEDGYVNATQMCKVNQKLIGHWFETEDCKRYTAALSSIIGIPIETMIISKSGRPSRGGGTWIHPKLAIKLARWISIEFEVWLDVQLKGVIENRLNDLTNVSSNKDLSGFVYLAMTPNGWCKIGMSKKPYRRMSSLQTGTPLEVTLVHRIFTFNMPGLEKALHDYFQAYWMRGEWFDLPKECIKEFPEIATKLDSELELLMITD